MAAYITLKSGISDSVMGERFQNGVTRTITNESLIKYLKTQGRYSVTEAHPEQIQAAQARASQENPEPTLDQLKRGLENATETINELGASLLETEKALEEEQLSRQSAESLVSTLEDQLAALHKEIDELAASDDEPDDSGDESTDSDAGPDDENKKDGKDDKLKPSSNKSSKSKKKK